MNGIVWRGPQRTSPVPWAGRQAGSPGQGNGLRVAIRLGERRVVEVSGEIDLHSGAELREKLLWALRRHGPCLTLDLRGVTFIDSAGIEVLLATRRRAQLEGGWVNVAQASPCAQRMITLAGLRHIFTPPEEA